MEQPPPAYSEKSGYPPQNQYPPPVQPGYPPPAQPGYVPPPQGYPPQQPGYAQPPSQGYQQGGGYPPPPPPTSTVVVQPANIVVGGVLRFGEFPQNVTCGSCQANVVTAVEYVTGTLTWLIAGILFLVGCWLCCFIPICVDGCKDAVHKCPNCHNVIGVYRRM